ncbi:hypothetical protein P8891_05710 [Bacillus atrophaeus]|uniref:hypothetical protein n=1 Tax=Bacillus atrophaeus TaxID=1452 RepID=UPI0022824A8A|nr:hypothetical protein [Bacillus atrophaeus]MCY7947948.1 hypothetical protein [Bacillus atrophaeus]MCY8098253.1 hypothetical protein [Bacillus atrophaeus]MCY9170030.1 hypothetical protein [Bacillus atrophaeus]MEC0740583.1 hypothetical protein [Bacillus atrophaeus]MEC0746981.1 hypothetical protein [Bacillus atrophaeus]
MEKNMINFLDLKCTITHIEHLNEGGEQFQFPSFIEYLGLYPNWDCNRWEIQLHYKGEKRKPFEIYTASEMGVPDLNDILMLIFSKDYRHMTRSQFKDDNEYNEFFKEYGEHYGGDKEAEEVLEKGLYPSGCSIARMLYMLMGKENFHALKNYIGYR